MVAKCLLVLFASACIIEMSYAQCIGAVNNILAAEELAFASNALAYGAGGLALASPYAAPALGCGYPAATIAPTSGGGFAVTSYSSIAPTGITVISDNAIEGAVAVNGMLPFLGAIALEGALPSAGAGGINYGCGSGAIGIVSEGIAPGAGPYGAPGVGPYGAPAVGPYGPIAPGGIAPGLAYPNALAGGLPYGPGLGAVGLNGRPALGLGGCGAIY